MSSFFLHDPGAVLDYGIDWAPLLPDGVTITASEWALDDGNASSTLEIAGQGNTDTVSTFVASGGTAGVNYRVNVHIVRSDGMEDDRHITLVVRER
ncbi:hypothetical protein JRC04_04865 [Mycolicibacterium sp. S2-37]|uniref:phage fiber-tail adaptor protein n=1 Tax=Mycolicibacterium sp. S2-37 TaxID=2810297 RepID=UPI001A952BB5|nr:hypothetical protein [Mycolicibacterium sp. S2-37]MBO0676791.1 hypothetical protein [Mycolicibacterium sp. S2-37]